MLFLAVSVKQALSNLWPQCEMFVTYDRYYLVYLLQMIYQRYFLLKVFKYIPITSRSCCEKHANFGINIFIRCYMFVIMRESINPL